MKIATVLCMGVSMTTTAWGAECGSSTVIQNGQNVTSVTQSGDCVTQEMHVEPGKTWLYRKSGGNVSITMQQSTVDQATLDRLLREFWNGGRGVD